VTIGRLRSDAKTCRALVDKHGPWMVAHARLYIGRRMIGVIDPSLSLHDDAETSICIAEVSHVLLSFQIS
jgi:hypothetical protein